MTRMKHGSTSHRAQNRRVKHQQTLEETVPVSSSRAYAVLNRASREIATVVAPDLANALWQARQLDAVKAVAAKEGGIYVLPTHRI